MNKRVTVTLTEDQAREVLEALAYVGRPSQTPVAEQRAFIARIISKLHTEIFSQLEKTEG